MDARSLIGAVLLVLGTLIVEPLCAQPQNDTPRRLVASDVKLPIPDAALQAQFEQLSAMPSVQVEYSRLGSVERVKGRTGLLISPPGRAVKFNEPADEILRKLRGILLAKGTEKLIVRASLPFPNMGTVVLRMEQTIRGIPVEGSTAVVEIETLTGEIVEASFRFVPDHGLPEKPKVSAAQASSIAIRLLEESEQAEKGSVKLGPAPKLKYLRPLRASHTPKLVWAVDAVYVPTNPESQAEFILFVDAITGEVTDLVPSSIVHAVNWPAYTAFNHRLGPGAHDLAAPSCRCNHGVGRCAAVRTA